MKLRYVVLVLALCAPASATAQVWYGPQASYVNGIGPGIGARVVTELAPLLGSQDRIVSRLTGALAADYVFMEEATFFGEPVDQKYWEVNGSVAYMIPIKAAARPYAGAGLSLGKLSSSASAEVEEMLPGNTSGSMMGLNLLAGVRFPQVSVPFFLELRLSTIQFAADGSSEGEKGGIYLTGGLLFGGR